MILQHTHHYHKIVIDDKSVAMGTRAPSKFDLSLDLGDSNLLEWQITELGRRYSISGEIHIKHTYPQPAQSSTWYCKHFGTPP